MAMALPARFKMLLSYATRSISKLGDKARKRRAPDSKSGGGFDSTPPTWKTGSNLTIICHYILHYRAFNKNIRAIKLSLSIILTVAFRNHSREILTIDQVVCTAQARKENLNTETKTWGGVYEISDSLCVKNLVVINRTANKTDKINTT